MKNKYVKHMMFMFGIVAMNSQMSAVIPDADIDAANATIIALSKRRNDAMRVLERENPKEGQSKWDDVKALALTIVALQAKLDEVKDVYDRVKVLPVAEAIIAADKGDMAKGDPKGMVSRQKQRYIATLRATIRSLKIDEEFLEYIIEEKRP